jgi:hypothetical protein
MGSKLTTPAASRLDRGYIALHPSGAYMTCTQACSPEVDPAAARSPSPSGGCRRGRLDTTRCLPCC